MVPLLSDDLQTKITPKHLLVKTNINNPSSETENFYGNQNNLLATQHLSTEEMVSQSFKRFKYRLHSVGIRWLAAKQQDNGYGMVRQCDSVLNLLLMFLYYFALYRFSRM